MIAGDDVVNIAEKAAGFTIKGATGSALALSGIEPGVSVSVTIGSQPPLTTISNRLGRWSVRVPAGASWIAGTSVSVTVTAEKAGSASPDAVTRSVAVDLTAPSVSWTAPASLSVGVAIDAVTPVTSDTDIASYRATGLPSGLTIHGTTGVIDGTPDTADTPDETVASAVVVVTDSAGQRGRCVACLPGGCEERPGSGRIRLQLGHGDVWQPGADIDGAQGGAGRAGIFGDAIDGVQWWRRRRVR